MLALHPICGISLVRISSFNRFHFVTLFGLFIFTHHKHINIQTHILFSFISLSSCLCFSDARIYVLDAALNAAVSQNLSLDESVKLIFLVSNALFDAGIAAWDVKRAFDSVRPITAIQCMFQGQMIESWAGPYLGVQLIDGSRWLPYQVTIRLFFFLLFFCHCVLSLFSMCFVPEFLIFCFCFRVHF